MKGAPAQTDSGTRRTEQFAGPSRGGAAGPHGMEAGAGRARRSGPEGVRLDQMDMARAAAMRRVIMPVMALVFAGHMPGLLRLGARRLRFGFSVQGRGDRRMHHGKDHQRCKQPGQYIP